ncbi:MAG: T9SS type A sorting domain-containing protein [bacterium]|nr:T9SS type A sorting domain-containing protein [bacterium]
MRCSITLILGLFCLATLTSGQPFYVGTYGGNPHCEFCHATGADPTNQFTHWNRTPHAGAYDDYPEVQWDSNCLPCHTTGWDLSHSNHGFDDYFFQSDTVGMQSMRNVQCEACHGPTDQVPHPATTVIDRHSELCGGCHTGMGKPTYDDWLSGPHALNAPAAAQNQACARCHEAESAAFFHRTGTVMPSLPSDPVWQTTCSACHATHARPVFGAQLYMSPDSTCRACHNMEDAAVGAVPHAPQHNMLVGMGTGAYEWPGYTYNNSCHNCMVPGTCALCHMDVVNYSGQDSLLTGHTFAVRIETCIVCHPDWVPPDSSFDFLGMQTIIDSLCAELDTLLGVADTTLIEWQQAKFDYDFVVNDGSRGIHNFFYAEDLLVSSIEGLSAVSGITPLKPIAPQGFQVSVSPNPFNPITTISYELRAASFVNLSVYDISGQKVVELVNGVNGVGEHRVTLDGSRLASGIYLYQLEAGEHWAAGKLVLLK